MRHEIYDPSEDRYLQSTLLQKILDAVPYADCKYSYDYTRWERMASVFIKLEGYTNIRWYTSDGDSFGPLCRTVTAELNGIRYSALYS